MISGRADAFGFLLFTRNMTTNDATATTATIVIQLKAFMPRKSPVIAFVDAWFESVFPCGVAPLVSVEPEVPEFVVSNEPPLFIAAGTVHALDSDGLPALVPHALISVHALVCNSFAQSDHSVHVQFARQIYPEEPPLPPLTPALLL
jgi:hypothetical protein